jgi:hypothetical protein
MVRYSIVNIILALGLIYLGGAAASAASAFLWIVGALFIFSAIADFFAPGTEDVPMGSRIVAALIFVGIGSFLISASENIMGNNSSFDFLTGIFYIIYGVHRMLKVRAENAEFYVSGGIEAMGYICSIFIIVSGAFTFLPSTGAYVSMLLLIAAGVLWIIRTISIAKEN